MTTNFTLEDTHTFFNEPEHQPFELGDGQAGALLLHGFPGTPAEMLPLGRWFAEHNFTARGILLPGFGSQIMHLGETDRHAWLDAARTAWGELRANHRPAILVGFSMGGALALHLAQEAPPDALVLLAPFWRMGGWQFNLLPLLKRVMPTVAPFEKANFDDPAVRRELLKIAPGVDLADPEVQRFFREEVCLPTAVVDEVRRVGLEAAALAPNVTAPTLVLQGKSDETVMPAYTRLLVGRLGGAVTYREFPGDHTFARMAAPDSYDFGADVLFFLRRTGVLPTLEAAYALETP